MTSMFDPEPLLVVVEGLHAALQAGKLPRPVLVADIDGNPLVTSDDVKAAYQALTDGETLAALKPLVDIGEACAWSRIPGITFGQYDDTPILQDTTGQPLLTIKQAMNAAAIQARDEIF